MGALVGLVLLAVCGGCAALTESQLKTVNSLAVTADSVAVVPSIMFKGLAEVRKERGLF